MAKKKTPLVMVGTPAPETPEGQLYAQGVASYGGEEIVNRDEGNFKLSRVPLYAQGIVRQTAKIEITGKEEGKTFLSNGIRNGQGQVEDEEQLYGNARSIGTSLYEEIVGRMPRHLAILDDGQTVVFNSANLRNKGDKCPNDLKHLFYLIVDLFTTADEDFDNSRTIQGGIDDINRKETEAQRQRRLVDEKHRNEVRNAEFKKEMKDDHNSGGL